MAKITINPITSGNNLETAINLRLQQIEDSFNDDVLWRANFVGEANQMEVDLDMNENDILNLLELTLGEVSVKADIQTNQTDIEELKTAVNMLWPRGEASPFDVDFGVRWGDIGGNIVDQADLHSWLTGHDTDIAANTSGISTNAAAIAAETAARTAADALKVDLAGDTMDSGADLTFAGGGEVLGLPATPSATGAASKEYVDLHVEKGGDTMTGQLKGITPVADEDLARKDYVDTTAVDNAIAFAIALGG